MTETRYRLVIKAGGVIGTTYDLEVPELYLGRDVQNDIVVPEAEVSRRHARLIRDGEVYLLEDLGSTNGTFINGKRLVAPHILRPGDEVQLGPNVVFVYERVTDPNATVAVQAQTIRSATRQIPQPPAQPQQEPAPPTPPPPPLPEAAAPEPAPAPAYVAPPRPAEPQPAVPEKKKSRTWLYLILLALIFLCLVVAAGLWYIDANRLWCAFFPFFFPGACP